MTKLLWIRRRARRILNAFKLGPTARARSVAVKAAAADWSYFNPQGVQK